MSYVIMAYSADAWIFWAGKEWAKEYPDAVEFTSLDEAYAKAMKAKIYGNVFENYGRQDERYIGTVGEESWKNKDATQSAF